MKTVAILGSKGGTGKSSLTHALTYGAHLLGQDAVMVHTDQRPPVKSERPYRYLDASANYSLVTNLVKEHQDAPGFMVIDGAGNRPHVDLWVARSVDLVLIPVTNSAEDVRCAMNDLSRFADPRVHVLINRWPSNRLVRMVVQKYVDQLPESRVLGHVSDVGAVRRFLDDGDWGRPPTKVNNLARGLYRMVNARVEEQRQSGLESFEQSGGVRN